MNDGAGFHLYQWGAHSGLDFFGVIDFFTSRIMLPLGGLCFVVFAGWVMNRERCATNCRSAIRRCLL